MPGEGVATLLSPETQTPVSVQFIIEAAPLWMLRCFGVGAWIIFGGHLIVGILSVLQGQWDGMLFVFTGATGVWYLAGTRVGHLEWIAPGQITWVTAGRVSQRIDLVRLRSFGWFASRGASWSDRWWLSTDDLLNVNTGSRHTYVTLYSGRGLLSRRWILTCSDVRTARDTLLSSGINAHALYPWANG